MRKTDYKRKLINYIKKNLKKGYTAESLRWALVKQGYSKLAVEDAIKKANKELAESAPVLKEKPRIKYEILDENNQPIRTTTQKPWWKRIF